MLYILVMYISGKHAFYKEVCVIMYNIVQHYVDMYN